MRNARLALGAVTGFALLAVLSTAAWSQDSRAADQKKDDSTQSVDGVRSVASADKSDAKSMSPSGKGGPKAPVLRLRAFAFNPNRANPGTGTGSLDIVIERWSTPAERDRLTDVLAEQGGGDALLSAVQKIKPRCGYINTPGSVGWDLQFAQEVPLPDGGRRILLGSDRPMGFWERANQPRSSEYEFMLAEIRLDKDGRGDGALSPAASVGYDEDTKTVEVENYENQPVRLTEVQVVK